MSREIKFRAWDKENEEYRNGYEVLLKYDGSAISRYALGALDTDIPVNAIIEQCTGLEDRNGKEIYEGDIVEIGKYGKFQIIWNEWACKFDFDKIGKREREEPLLSQDWEQKAEVIGNIHEKEDEQEVDNDY